MFSRCRRRVGLVMVLVASLLFQQVAVAAFAAQLDPTLEQLDEKLDLLSMTHPG